MNPTNAVLEERVAALEEVQQQCSSSGSSATTIAIQNLCSAGDNIVSTPPIRRNLESIRQYL